jgi:hypothetical protein
MTDQLIEIYECGCQPQLTYKTKQTYKNHFKSDRHRFWECRETLQHLRQTVVELENKVSSLKVERDIWKELAVQYKRRYEPTDLLLD